MPVRSPVGQPSVVLNKEGGNSAGVRSPSENAKQVAPIASAGADYAHRLRSGLGQDLVDLVVGRQ